jgi:hypothetical protein
MRAKLKAIKMELRKRMHDPVAKTGAWVKQMLQGHLNYYAVSGNHPGPVVVLQSGAVALAQDASAPEPEGRSVLGALHQPRRSLLSADQDTTPAALSPFRRQNPREEPGALAALAGICAGCALKAHVTQSPGMAAAAKLSQQPRTESCVVSGNGRCEA